MRHLIDPTDLTRKETEEIVDLALDIIANRPAYAEACKGKNWRHSFMNPQRAHASASRLQ